MLWLQHKFIAGRRVSIVGGFVHDTKRHVIRTFFAVDVSYCYQVKLWLASMYKSKTNDIEQMSLLPAATAQREVTSAPLRTAIWDMAYFSLSVPELYRVFVHFVGTIDAAGMGSDRSSVSSPTLSKQSEITACEKQILIVLFWTMQHLVSMACGGSGGRTLLTKMPPPEERSRRGNSTALHHKIKGAGKLKGTRKERVLPIMKTKSDPTASEDRE